MAETLEVEDEKPSVSGEVNDIDEETETVGGCNGETSSEVVDDKGIVTVNDVRNEDSNELEESKSAKTETEDEKGIVTVEVNGEGEETNIKSETRPLDNGVGDGKEDTSEVITVPDTGDDVPITTVPDVVFYDSVTEEEKNYYEENALDYDAVDEMKVQCTACWKQVNHHVLNNIQRHPELGVPICRACKDFYEDGEWEKDDEGVDMYCKWCGNGGEVVGCDKCSQVFCKRCITRNLGRSKYTEINDSDEWACFTCDPSQIYMQRNTMYCISKWAQVKREKKRQREQEKIMKKKMESSKKKAEAKKTVREKKLEQELEKIENFIDENIHEAFETLTIYQKCLEDERKKWIKLRKSMNSSNAATVSKSLRRIYGMTRQNMELLDTALLQGYSEAFPEENADVKLKTNTGPASKVTSPAKTSANNTPKKTPTKKKKPPKKTLNLEDEDCIEVEEIVVNGEPVFENGENGEGSENGDGYIDPSLLCSVEITGTDTGGSGDEVISSNKKKSTATPIKPKLTGPLRISSNMFKRKKAPSVSPQKAKKPKSDDAEIEEITLDDSDNSTGYVSQATMEYYSNRSVLEKANKFVQDDGDDSDVSLY